MVTPTKNTTTLSRQTGYYPPTPTKPGQGNRPTTTISSLEPKRLDGYYPGKQGENPTLTQENNGQSSSGGKRRKRSRKGGKWSMKYKRSINCRRPKGFSQKQHCKYGRRSRRR